MKILILILVYAAFASLAIMSLMPRKRCPHCDRHVEDKCDHCDPE